MGRGKRKGQNECTGVHHWPQIALSEGFFQSIQQLRENLGSKVLPWTEIFDDLAHLILRKSALVLCISCKALQAVSSAAVDGGKIINERSFQIR